MHTRHHLGCLLHCYNRDGASVWIADRCGGNTCADSTVAPILKLDPDYGR